MHNNLFATDSTSTNGISNKTSNIIAGTGVCIVQSAFLHSLKPERAWMTNKHGLVYVMWVHGYLVESGAKVKGAVLSGAGEGVEAAVNPRLGWGMRVLWQGNSIWVIYTKVDTTVFLF